MPATSSCPNCDALLDTSSFAPGSRMSCSDCGKPFVVGDTPRSAAPLDSRPYPVAVALTPSAQPVAAPRASRPAPREPGEGDNTGRWVVIGICLFFLVVVLGGVGFLILRAHSEGGGWGGPSTPPPARFKGNMKDDDWKMKKEREAIRAIEEAEKKFRDEQDKAEREKKDFPEKK